MRYLILFSICFFSWSFTFSQNDTIYFNEDWDVIAAAEDAAFYRLGSIDEKSNLYVYTDYYISGNIQCTGAFQTDDQIVREGEYIWYYESGHKSTQGSYEGGDKVGKWERWFENGQPSEVAMYNTEEVEWSVIEKWDSSGNKVISNGTGSYVDYFNNGQIDDIGEFKKGKKHGVWKSYYKDGDLYFEEEYKKGVLKSGMAYIDGEQYEYNVIRENAYMEGCEKMSEEKRKECTDVKIMEHISTIEYPDLAVEREIEDRVIVKFVVGLSGEIEDVQAMNQAHPILVKAAIEHVSSLKGMKPGKFRGRPVRVQYTVPINFKLEDPD